MKIHLKNSAVILSESKDLSCLSKFLPRQGLQPALRLGGSQRSAFA
jgi:hypothetical protein